MKKLAFLALVLLVSREAFAQIHFSVAGEIGTSFSSISPALNAELNLKPVDVLLGAQTFVPFVPL